MLCSWGFVTIVVLHGATCIHGTRGDRGAGVPIRNVLVERLGVVEHICQSCDAGHIPVVQI